MAVDLRIIGVFVPQSIPNEMAACESREFEH
jgi:hypothetical protein